MATAEQALKIAPDESRRPIACSERSTRRWRRRPRARASGRTARPSARTSPRRSSISSRRSKVRWAAPTPIFARCWRGSTSAAPSYDKAIAMLTELVKQEPHGRTARRCWSKRTRPPAAAADAVRWLEEAVPDDPELYPTLADFYARERRWREAAAAYEQALQVSPRSSGLRVGYATALMNLGGKDGDGEGAHGAARGAWRRAAPTRPRCSCCRRPSAAWAISTRPKAAARRLIAQNARNVRGFVALAEALEERRRYQAVVDALAPAMAAFRQGQNASVRAVAAAAASRLCVPADRAVRQGRGDVRGSAQAGAERSDADRLSDSGAAGREELHGGRRARASGARRPTRRSAARAARGRGAPPERARRSGHRPARGRRAEAQRRSRGLHRACAAVLGRQPRRTGRQAAAGRPDEVSRRETSLTFELAAVLEKQKKYAEAEAVFRQLIARDPDHAAALNYLGYMLAERGERLDESVGLIRRALEIEPDNGSYLDSLGWAYFKGGKLDLAEEHLKRAADQLVTNSVVQDHYGDVLVRLGRFDEAIAAWNRALSGDGDSIDRSDIDRKIRSAEAKTSQTMILRRAGRALARRAADRSCGARLMKLPSGPGAPAPDMRRGVSARHDRLPRRVVDHRGSRRQRIGRRPPPACPPDRRARGARLGRLEAFRVRPADFHLRRAGRRRDAAAAAREPRPRARPCRRDSGSRRRHPARRRRICGRR